MPGLYRTIRDDVEGIWTAAWTQPAIPVFWRDNDPQPVPDPVSTQHFFRNEVDFGLERIIAFGGGRHANFRCQYGSVILRCFTSRMIGDEDEALDLLDSAVALFRSQRETDGSNNDLSFIGQGSGFDWGPGEDGNWFMRSVMLVFEYRFYG